MKYSLLKLSLYIICLYYMPSYSESTQQINFKAFGGMSISKQLFDYIRKMLPDGSTILECGSGWASGELSQFYTVYSIEHDPRWVGKYNTNYIHAPIVNGWYDTEAIKQSLPQKYDLILIDGPTGQIGRMPFYDHISLFNTDVPIILDDVNRTAEHQLLFKLGQLLERTPQIIASGNKKFGLLLPQDTSNAKKKNLDDIALQLYNNDMILVGNFLLKSNAQSSVYIDLRKLISYPTLFVEIAKRIQEKVYDCPFDLVCGVPHAALPLATVFSIQTNIPMIMKRKETKTYGTKKEIEGVYQPGNTCLLIEDVLTTGSSILETIEILEKHEIVIKDVVVVVARTKEGIQNVEKRGYKVHALYTLSELLSLWHYAGKISTEQFKLIA